MRNKILIFLALLIVIAVGTAYEIFWAPNSFESDRFVIVSKGETFRHVELSLEKAGVIRSRFLFEIAGRLTGYTTRLQIGKYRFRSGMSNLDIINDIRTGSTVESIMTALPEGLRATRQASFFARRLGIDSARFMELVTDTALIRSLGVEGRSLEGYLMPMTYHFYWQCSEEEIIRTLVAEFWSQFNDTLRNRAAEKGMTIGEVLTMASIVEHETAVDSERSVIAGVYYNRLKKNMRLQADPTVQYAMEGSPRRLHYSDLAINSPYNTYLHTGLPPGPINNPGIESIRAALYPSRHRYLFFVANGAGGHTFTRTFTAHRRAAGRYHELKEEQRSAKNAG